MKATFHLGWVTAASLLAVNTAGEGTLSVSSGSPSRQILLSVPIADRLATQEPRAPDLASALWVVTPLPITVPARYGYYGTARSLNDRGDFLGNDLSQMKHVSSDGVVTDLGIYRFHYNSGRQLDNSGRLALNAAVGTDGLLLQLRDGLPPTETRFTDTRLTSVDNEGGLLGVALNLSRLTDQDYWGQHFLQRGTSRRDLPAPADSGFGADFVTLNERDEVAGSAYQIPREWWRGLYLKPGNEPRWLPGFGAYEEVYNMNTHGQIVGSSSVPAGFGYAPGMYPAFWENGGVGRIAILDTDRSLFGGEYGWAWAINRWGHVVGRTRSGGKLWLNGRPHDLTGKVINLENVRLDYFSDINDKGEIIGAEYAIGGTQGSRAFIMRPIWPALAVDLNRDGIISLPSDGDKSDLTTPAMPFRFWINDDDDIDSDDPDNAENAPIEQADMSDDKIDGIRDLEDFARIDINLDKLRDLIESRGLRVGLKWRNRESGNPAIKVWRNLSPNGGAHYFHDEAIARLHLGLASPGAVHGSSTYILPEDFWQQTVDGVAKQTGHLIFEGCSEGKAELAFTVHRADGAQVCEGPGVWLDLKNIKHMYERVRALADSGDDIEIPSNFPGPDGNNIPRPSMSWVDDAGGHPFQEPQGGTSTCIVMIHGWNQTYERSTMYSETSFKRLWHRGYKGRFVRFRWPTYVGVLSYNNSEYKAWKFGESLHQYLGSIPRGEGGFSVNLIAHSMGNIVAGEALRRGAFVSNYALLNAAVPSVSYDSRGALDQGWGYTHPNDDPDNYTKSLAYGDRFAGVRGNLINFFLPDDSALGAWRANNALSKPQRWTSGFVAGYGYDRQASSGQKLYVEFWTAFGRGLTDAHEAMAYAVKSPTLAVGADSELVDENGAVYGSISREVDMRGPGYDFGSVHSAEFLFPPQKTKVFYDRVLEEFGLPVMP